MFSLGSMILVGIFQNKNKKFKGIYSKDLLYSIGNYTQYFIITCKEKESEKEHKCITESLCHKPETNTAL